MTPHWSEQLQREQLHQAVQAGDLNRVKELLAAKYPINKFDELGKTPLHYAVRANYLSIAQLLIASGANLNAHDERVIGNTPLSDNAKECSLEMATLLIKSGADPTIPGWMQLNALDRAKKRKDTNADKVRKLLNEAAKRRRA